MKKVLVLSLLFTLILLSSPSSADGVTYCFPSSAECVRIDNYVNNTLISTSVYYGIKVSAPPAIQ